MYIEFYAPISLTNTNLFIFVWMIILSFGLRETKTTHAYDP
jgi:hypothetical protein